MRMVDTVGYAPNNMGEFIMQFGMLLAATQSHRVVGGKIMAFNDFYNDNLEKLLQDVLTNEQYDKYLIFKEDLDAEIAREEKRTSKSIYGITIMLLNILNHIIIYFLMNNVRKLLILERLIKKLNVKLLINIILFVRNLNLKMVV